MKRLKIFNHLSQILKFNRRIKRLFFKIILIFFFLFLIFIINFFLSIKEIEIICRDCEKKQIVGLDLIKNKNLITILFNKKNIEKKFLLVNPGIKKVKLEINSLIKLRLYLDYYQPTACLFQDSTCYFLSEDGRIIKKSQEQELNLPKIFYYQRLPIFYYKTGIWIDYNDIKFTLSMINLFRNLNYLINKVEIKSEEMIIFELFSQQQILLSSKKDLDKQKYELTQILKQFKIKGSSFKKIDLRFNKPVVVFN